MGEQNMEYLKLITVAMTLVGAAFLLAIWLADSQQERK